MTSETPLRDPKTTLNFDRGEVFRDKNVSEQGLKAFGALKRSFKQP
jgi:hypothetical protein